ncbi:MAG: response regulator [Bacteroidota bacterium]|nr:response regulator [Bacteroidota bacterium]
MSSKILVVEDDAINMDYILVVLKKINGITTEKAINGKIAIDLFNKTNPDIVLLDIRLPDIDGFEIIKYIKEKSPETIVIAQTAHALQADEERVLNAGFDAFVSKPMKPADLINVVNKYLL